MDSQATDDHRPGNKRIAYILGRFPALTMTFIDREIVEAKRKGTELVLVAMRGSPPFEMRPEVAELAKETEYLVPIQWPRLFRSFLFFVVTQPLNLLSLFLFLVSRAHGTLKARVKTAIHFAEGVEAAGILRGRNVDHIHAHFADRASVVAMVVSRLLKIEYSLTAHANDIYISPVLLQEKLAQAKFVTTCTGYNKEHLERVTGKPVELIYHGLDLDQLQSDTQNCPAESPASDAPLLLSVGQLKEKKGFPVLLDACAQLRDQGYEFRCEIIGEGPDRKALEAHIEERQLGNLVTLRGELPNRAVMARYTEATLFTLPCVVAKNDDRDGIPNVMLEAMAHGLPVVSTAVSGIPEVIEDEITGLLVESGSAAELAKGLARILDDSELRERLGDNGRDLVRERFDIHRNIGRLVELLES